MIYQVTHTTEYNYHQAVSLCHNIAKLHPRDTDQQLCRKNTVIISPEPDVINEYEDFFGNKVIYFVIQQEHKTLKVTVISLIEKYVASNLQIDLYSNASWEELQQHLREPVSAFFDARQYVPETTLTPITEEITDYARQSFHPGRPVLEAAKELTHRIFTDFEFKPGFTTVTTPLQVVMKERKGVCQDFAHLAIACMRSVGLPSRYVSGYIETVPPEGEEKLTGVDASHAWFSVFIPGTGWVDFDPTNNQMPSSQHITIGWGRDYADITPLKGVIFSSGPHELDVSVDVRRLG